MQEASRQHVANPREPKLDWRQGYGYQFWRCRHHGYRGDGAYGQFCLVLPEQDAVVVITAATEDMQGILDAVWAQLLPALNNVEALPRAHATVDLENAAPGAELPFPAGERQPAAELHPDGWVLGEATGERAACRFRSGRSRTSDDGGLLTMADDRAGISRAGCGYQTWARTELEVSEGHRLQTAAAAAWTNPSTFTAEVTLRGDVPSVADQLRCFDRDRREPMEHRAAVGDRTSASWSWN